MAIAAAAAGKPRGRGRPRMPRPISIGRYAKTMMMVGNLRAQIKPDREEIKQHAAWIFVHNRPVSGEIIYGIIELPNGTCIMASSSAGPNAKPVAGIFHGGIKVTLETRPPIHIPTHDTIVMRTYGDSQAATVGNLRRLGLRI